MKPEPVNQSYVGQRVILGQALRDERYRGMHGYVKRAVKSRGCYHVVMDNGRHYDALPGNVILEASE